MSVSREKQFWQDLGIERPATGAAEIFKDIFATLERTDRLRAMAAELIAQEKRTRRRAGARKGYRH